ncbi:MAG TPA: tetratricopeptide repeat protein [Oleiagrimonas sp.]|nr:tetratricopeptide repeat protein [Oleiagrimonas sp.]
MSTALIANLRAQCGGPRDGALLRFSLANALLTAGDAGEAVTQCRRALDFDANYSAAWKLLGKALLTDGDEAGAAKAWRQGIAVAAECGDKQAEREMAVFLRRLEKSL